MPIATLLNTYSLPMQADSQSCTNLQDFLVNPNSYIIIDLSNQLIGNNGLIALSDALWRNSTLIELNLENNGIGYSGIKYLLSWFLYNNKSLKSLNLANNCLGCKEITKLLGDGSLARTAITKLDLSYNYGIYDEGERIKMRTILENSGKARTALAFWEATTD